MSVPSGNNNGSQCDVVLGAGCWVLDINNMMRIGDMMVSPSVSSEHFGEACCAVPVVKMLPSMHHDYVITLPELEIRIFCSL
eukprot:scaffold58674_cov44-Attheya_sp.AAC.1